MELESIEFSSMGGRKIKGSEKKLIGIAEGNIPISRYA